jgi:precorrin-2 dehydrogenase/sirohydrochlorin ferrochelatase
LPTDPNNPDNPYLPLFIDFSDKLVVIFGGGTVGERKACRFLQKAKVTVISRSLTPALETCAASGRIQYVSKDLSELTEPEIRELITGAFLVIPATPDAAINQKIMNAAKTQNILINSTQDADEVILPSFIERGGLLIAISSGGDSPAVTKFARMKIESVIDGDFEKMISLQNDVREHLKTVIPDQKKRGEILWQIMNDEEIWRLLSKDFGKAKEAAFNKVKKM